MSIAKFRPNTGLFRVAVLGGRSAYGRLAGIAGGVAVGVCLLLLLWGGANGLQARDDRGAWLRETGNPSMSASLDASGALAPIPLTPGTALMRTRGAEVFRDQLIERRDFAALPSATVRVPGIGKPPEPGSYYASPALQRLIESTPADQLGDRFGKFAGIIDSSALPGPDSLIVITGAPESELRGGGNASLVSDFTSNPYGGSAASYVTVLTIGAIAVFFPVLLLISIVTGLGAAQRRERFATLRLMGAPPRTVAWIAAVEVAIPSFAGAMVGVGLAALLTPAAAEIPVNGTRMFASDLHAGWLAAVMVVAVVVAASALVAGVRTARADVGPLGVNRAVHERVLTAWRTVPLLLGIALMATAVVTIRVLEIRLPWLESPMLVVGFLAVLAGIVVIGPWLTRTVSRRGLRHARRAAAVIAASRIQRTPVATFRSVSGLVIAVFVVSVFAGGSSVIQSTDEPVARPGLLHPSSLMATLRSGESAPSGELQAAVAKTVMDATSKPGIRNAVTGYGPAAFSAEGAGPELFFTPADARALGFEDIPSSETVAVDGTFLYFWTTQPLALKPAPSGALEGMVPVVLVLGTDGTPEAMDRARTVLDSSGVTATPASATPDTQLQSSRRLVQGLAVLAYLGMFVSVAIAGLSLAVGTAAAIMDRRRVLGLMRLMGMPTSVLRGIVVREAAVPLLSVLLLSVGLGFLTAWLLVTAINHDYHVTWPEPGYFVALGMSLALACCAVAGTFGLARGNTALTATRFE
ncbi:FtsX-like permease family protein [Paenarthrobacter sp. NPDC057355]|uniref:FtsX-like permease family protein n=1 Tax=Paenarthrobacter sp. NPDC057355 TaxID=3346105 RepID=UPI00363A8C5E